MNILLLNELLTVLLNELLIVLLSEYFITNNLPHFFFQILFIHV